MIQRGFTLLEVLIVSTILMILMAIAIPKARQMMMASREMAAMREIDTIHTAQVQYYSVYSHYAPSLKELGPAPAGQETAEQAGLLPKSVAEGKKSGYLFSLVGGGENYSIWAIPEKWNNSGRRTFYSDQTRVLRNNWSAELASPASPEVGDGPTDSTPAPVQ